MLTEIAGRVRVFPSLAKPCLANTNFGHVKFAQHQLWPKP